MRPVSGFSVSPGAANLFNRRPKTSTRVQFTTRRNLFGSLGCANCAAFDKKLIHHPSTTYPPCCAHPSSSNSEVRLKRDGRGFLLKGGDGDS